MRKEATRKNMCAPMAAASAGLAICLSGGGAQGAIQTGSIAASNGGKNFFDTEFVPYLMNVFDYNAIVSWSTNSVMGWFSNVGDAQVNASGTYMNFHNAGVNVNSTMAGNFNAIARVVGGQGPSYLAVRFQSGGTKYGWIEVISTNVGATRITLGDWGYEDSGAAILTLSESVVGKRLKLTDGSLKLHWTNKNEQGVARYEVQRKNAAGAWTAVESEVPGIGRYEVKTVPGDYRLVVEKIDGTSEEIQF